MLGATNAVAMVAGHDARAADDVRGPPLRTLNNDCGLINWRRRCAALAPGFGTATWGPAG